MRLVPIGFFVSVATGIVFRLIWLEDIEYRDDEGCQIQV